MRKQHTKSTYHNRQKEEFEARQDEARKEIRQYLSSLYKGKRIASVDSIKCPNGSEGELRGGFVVIL